MNLLTFKSATRVSLESIGRKNAKQLRIFLDEPDHTPSERRHARNCLDRLELLERNELKRADK